MFDTFKIQTGGLDEVKIPNIKEFAKNAKLKFEKDVIGVYMSGHPLQNHADKFAKFTFNGGMIKKSSDEDEFVEDDDNQQIEQESEIADGTMVTCGGIIVGVKKLTSKASGQNMAILDIEDLDGLYSAMISTRLYEKTKNMLAEDVIVSISGRYSKRDDREPIIMVERISEIKE